MTRRRSALADGRDQAVHEIALLREELDELKAEKFKAEVIAERYASLYHYAPVGHLVLNAQGKIIDANLTAALLLERRREAIIDSPLSLYVVRPNLGHFLDHLSECRRGAGRVCTELSIRLPRQRNVPVQLVTTQLPMTGEEPPYFQTSLMSLVEVQAIEQSLRTSEERLRVALQCANAANWEIDLTTRMLTCSQELHGLLGTHATSEAFDIATLVSRFHPADRERVQQLIRRVFAGADRELRGEFRTMDGAHSRWVLMLGRVIEGNDGIGQRVTGIAMDITDRKQAEEALRKAHETLEARVKDRTAELREANAELRRQIVERHRLEEHILAVSEREQRRMGQDLHDSLGQQLTGIGMFNSVLRDSLIKQELPEAKTVERIGQLLGDVRLQLRRIVAGLHPVAAEPNGLMTGLEQFVVGIRELYGVDCRFLCPKPVLIEDNSAATHLFRIAQEAVGNAFRHGKARHVTVGLRNSRGQITLEIRDDGSGIPKVRDNHGGLGLQIMRSRAESMGGALEIARRRTTGTVVRCLVPVGSEPPTVNAHEV